MAYNSAYTGAQIDAAVGAVKEKENTWDSKQNAITGTKGQIVGFGDDGKPVAQAAPSVPQNLSDLSEDATHRVVTDAEKNTWGSKADKPKAVPVTLTAAGWVDGVQTVTVSGVSADETAQEIRYIYPGSSAAAVVAAGLYISATAENSVTFSCLNDTPTADIAVCVEITEINYVAS